MNINIIKKQGDLSKLFLKGDCILEVYSIIASPCNILKYYIYNPALNEIEEIMPETYKIDFVDIVVSYKPCMEVFFASYREISDDQIEIRIRSFNIETKKISVISTFNTNSLCMTSEVKIKVFMLSPTDALVQTEQVNNNISDEIMGNIIFTQTLYSAQSDEPISIIEENLNNNGINNIIPINDSEVLIKTGYSFLEDNRLSFGSQNDALIESLYRTTLKKFISDINLKQTNIDMNLLVTTYYEKYIINPKVKDEFLFYTVVNMNEHSSECVFTNYITEEKFTVVIPDLNPQDMNFAYVINNDPYIRRTTNNDYDFINVRTAENDISFVDELFVEIIGKLFVFESTDKKHSRLRLYNYPRMDTVLDEKYSYIAGINKDDDYYVYVR